MIKSGIMVQKLDISQLSFNLIGTLNDLTIEQSNLDVIVFYEQWAKFPLLYRFCTMMEREVWGIQGKVIATDVKTALRLLKCPGPTKKYFYVWNLEWVMAQNLNYDELKYVYNNPSLELIARSESHAELISKVWKEPAFIMDDFDKKILKEILM